MNTREDIDVQAFTEWVEGLDEPACESTHLDRRLPTCTIRVVARKSVSCNGRRFNICEASYLWNVDAVATPANKCVSCGRPCRDCWTITAI